VKVVDEDAAIQSILEGTANETGAEFFSALVESLTAALGTDGAWVTEYLPSTGRLRTHACLFAGTWMNGLEMSIAGTPCQLVIEEQRLVFYADHVVELFPDDARAAAMRVASYLGVPLKDLDGTILGHLAVMDRQPMAEDPRAVALFKIFAGRAAAELRRLRADREVLAREEKLRRIVDTVLDTIVELDAGLRVTLVNRAGEQMLERTMTELAGHDFGRMLDPSSRAKLATLVSELDVRPPGQRSLWIAGGLGVRRRDGTTFFAEATLSRSDLEGRAFYTLVLRDVNERLEAEHRIAALTQESEYLRAELRAIQGFDDIVGNSPRIVEALRDVAQVAPTDSTVLILGETGTGKELFARAIHDASKRREHPLIRVNCAAIPSNLIEAELFGHEKGAFTGAVARRIGRFALADRGTIFLDEIGELPLELQPKLLRVLQEGEIEPLGGRTQRVDVRVVAATNRDLAREVREGRFREDLYYRLSVFPLPVPPLRERGDDVVVLAASFVDRVSRRLGRLFRPMTGADVQRIRAYPWPGNVRELENVIERAAITALGDRLNLDRALPESTAPTRRAAAAGEPSDRVRTEAEMEALEIANVRRALDLCHWRISGERGAAAMLGMKASTLSSRMKVLGIHRAS
jgi:PAS domain S-box-containing protein